MDFYLERKYIIIIGILGIGLIAGGLVLARQKRIIGVAGANLNAAFGKGWTEIKPRVADSTSLAEIEAPEKTKASELEKPIVKWCEIAGGKPVSEKQIIINEIAWMGTTQSYSDEWIELKNISEAPADLAGWQLQNKNQKIKIAFGEGEVLAPGSLYLLERTDDEAVPGIAADRIYKGGLANSNEALYLFDAGCRLRDSAAATAEWPAGDNAVKKTMVRQPNLLWQSSIVAGGTPKAENR
jgi:hypothetical protein